MTFKYLLTLVFVGSLFGISGRAAAQETVLDEIVSIVDGEIILLSEVNALVEGVVQQQRIPHSEELWTDAHNELIDQKVLLVHARRDTTMTIPPEQTQQEVDSRVQRLVAQAGSEQRVTEAYGKTIAELKAELTEPVRDQLMASEFQRRYLSSIKVTPSEVREWFARIPQDSLPQLPEIVRVAHVVRLPETDPAATAEARDIINTLRDSVASGNSTIAALSQYSDDPGSQTSEGRYDDTRVTDLVAEFGVVASQLEPGELSNIFETPFGFHFMRLHRRTGDLVSFSHILIKVDNSRVDPTTAIDFLASLRDSIDTKGLSFELAAKRHSEETRSATRGGYVADPRSDERDLVLEALGPSWQQTVATMETGDISEPVEFELLDGRRAWHIVLLQLRFSEHFVSLATDYARIEQIVMQEKRAKERDEWVFRLRQSVHVEIRSSRTNFTSG